MATPVHVLVVEDEALVRLDIVDFLVSEGFTVSEASSADEAIAALRQHADIQILFTDIEMPGSMDGLRLSAFVRDQWPPVRIALTSGRKIVDLADLPHGSLFFSKPYQATTVADSFRQIMST